ncbi:hypothetical protein DKG74_14820 [Zavarzinia aquatilis]|uniref:Alpha/beta hydrolase n=1 Tax=Zavarzinia aquatilis TaxID=2211142 RepID=A0A317E837_9PROT|nr:hypothetical protein DKG74_14820 [Zavarzinia aquatilis]
MEQGSDTLVITFNTRILDGGIPQKGWGETRLATLGYDIFALIDLKGLWYPERDMATMRDFIAPLLSRYKEVVTYGFSMGAYGALKYSAALGATRAYAFSPQYSIRPEAVARFDARRPREFYQADLHDRMDITAADLCPHAYVVYDPFFALDREHVRLIARAGPIDEIYACFTGHFSIRSVTETGGAGDLLASLRAGHGETPQVLRHRIRAGRVRSPTYMFEAASLLAARGAARRTWAVDLARRAVAIAPHNTAARNLLADLLMETGTSQPSLWSRLASRVGLADKGSARAAVLEQLAQDQVYFLADIAALHVDARQPEKARQVIMRAAEATIDDAAFWLDLARLLRRIGKDAKTAQLALGLAERSIAGGHPTVEQRRLIGEMSLAAHGRVDLATPHFRLGVAARKLRGGYAADLGSPGQIVRDGPRFAIAPGQYVARVDFVTAKPLAPGESVAVAIEVGTTPIRENDALATGSADRIARSVVDLRPEAGGEDLAGATIAFTVDKRNLALRFIVELKGTPGQSGTLIFRGITVSRVDRA